MAGKTITTYGHIKAGKLELLKRDEFADAIRGMRDGPIKLEVSRDGPVRSNQQSAWYWACIVPLITDAINDLQGSEAFTRDDVHNFLRAKFNTKTVVGEGEHEIRIAGSTTKLSTVEFSAYVEDVRNWAAEMLDIAIPDPLPENERPESKPRKRKNNDDIFVAADI